MLSDSVHPLPNAKQFIESADIYPAVGDRRCGNTTFAHVILGEHFLLGLVGQDDYETIFSGDIDLIVAKNRRSIVLPDIMEPLAFPKTLTGCYIHHVRNPTSFD